MKEILSVAANHLASFDKTGVAPMVEVILILSEPVYTIDSTGAQIRSRETTTERFVSATEPLRKLSEILNRLADEAEEELAVALAVTQTKAESEASK